MSIYKTIDELRGAFPESDVAQILELARILKIAVAPEEEMLMGTRWEDIKRGRAKESKKMIVTPDIIVDGEKIVGVCIDPRVALATATALIGFIKNSPDFLQKSTAKK